MEGVGRRLDRAAVLHDVSLQIAPGEFVILIGGSGSGKTTLLRIVAGLERAETGRVALRGRVVDDPQARKFQPPEARGLGMVFQDFALWPHMTAVENVEAAFGGARPNGRRAALALLRQLDIEALAARRPAQLSGGQQQRVGLARALAARSDLLLLDEPLSSLDVTVRERMRVQIRSLVREAGAAALFVSHDPLDAWRLADRVIVLEQGRVVQAATPDQLYAAPATAQVAAFTDAVGGFPVDALASEHGLAIAWGGGRQPVTGLGVAAGSKARLYVRPRGVITGPTGAAARLTGRSFEAGLWRADWRLADKPWIVTSHDVAPPPVETRIALDPAHSFIFPDMETLR